MSERAQEELYFYNLYHGSKIEILEPMTSETPSHAPVYEIGASFYEFLDEHLQPDERWHNDICY